MSEVAGGCQEIASPERGEPDCGAVAESLHRGVDDQRNSRGNWALSIGGRQRYLCAGARISSGCDPHSHACAGGRGRACESGGARVDLVFAGEAFSTVAAARTQCEGKAVGAAAGCAGDCDADSGGAGDVDASDGASKGATST